MNDGSLERKLHPNTQKFAKDRLRSLRESAARKRKQAAECFAIAYASRNIQDRIAYEEFGRRAQRVAETLEERASNELRNT